MADFSHLNALTIRLAHEREYLCRAKSDGERKLRTVWISQIEREIACEEKFLGFEVADVDMSDDDLLAALAE